MKINFGNSLLLFFISLAFVSLSFSQDNSNYEFTYEINRVYPPVTMTKEKLHEAQTLNDLNERYEATWVRDYISVDILAIHKGKSMVASGKNETLNPEQKELMKNADVGTRISVTVHYIPENTLAHNDAKEIDFTFTVDPESEAKYIGGQHQLSKYLTENGIDKISRSDFKQYKMAAYKFTIDESGQVVNPKVFWSSDDDRIDEMLMESICNMPRWLPAEYADGTKIKQEFVLAVGDKQSCIVNLLSINQD